MSRRSRSALSRTRCCSAFIERALGGFRGRRFAFVRIDVRRPAVDEAKRMGIIPPPPRAFSPANVVHIGSHLLPNNLAVAPMAGVTDRPFRMLCKRMGAGYAVSEMVASRKDLWHTLKTSRRANHDGETAPISVQIAGTDR